jgi:Protein of unknown function (DUF3300)
MLMKALFERAFGPLLVLFFSVSVAFAQTPPPPRDAAATQQELDQMLAPIALYPDSLLSQILMASTYPLEVVEAARWSKANPGLQGKEAVDAVGERDWDASVKSLAAFPQVLAMMDQHLEWTARLGDVFIAQEPQVMETVQNLRRKAYDAGNLRSTEQARVSLQGDALAIEPASPEVVYVPYYDPRVAYGSWWWPAYPPVYWAPWPGYYAYPGYAVGFAWGGGITVGPGFFFSTCNWRARHVTIVKVTNVIVNRPGVGNRPVRTGQPVVWQHDPGHRRGVPYHIASLQQRFGPMSRAGQRRDFRWQGPVAPATRNSSLNRPEARGPHPRPSAPGRERPNPRKADDGRAGRPEGNPAGPAAARRGEVRPDYRVRATRPPVAAAPRAQPGPRNVPHVQGPAPQPGAAHNPQPHGLADRGQAENRPAPGAEKARGEKTK